VTDKGIERFRKRFRSLPPFPEVKRSLQRLQDAGLRLAALSNSSEAALNQQLKRAGLDQFFQHVVSVDRVQRFKPAREVYLEAVEEFANQPHELVMVAAHPWDLFGAGQAGYRTALIEREKVAPFPGGPEPHYRTADLSEFVNKLLGQEDEHSLVSGWLLAGCGVALGVAGTLIAATANPRTAQPIGAHALP
jgi:2-haloacid dehalogenase